MWRLRVIRYVLYVTTKWRPTGLGVCRQVWRRNSERLRIYINFSLFLKTVIKLLVSILFIHWLPISVEQNILKVLFLHHLWSTLKVLFTNTKIFQVFRSRIFAYCQSDELLGFRDNFRNATCDLSILKPAKIRLLPKTRLCTKDFNTIAPALNQQLRNLNTLI